jgi:hypothetical protein
MIDMRQTGELILQPADFSQQGASCPIFVEDEFWCSNRGGQINGIDRN